MAIRRFNFTGRKKIHREDAWITLYERPNGPIVFDAELANLSKYNLPYDAIISVEARLQTRWMRFAYGTVGAVTPPADRTLTEFDTSDGIVFSVKVTATSDFRGILVAEASGIPIRYFGEDAGRRCPLLPVKSDDIGQEVYRLDFSNDPPILLVNRAAGDKDLIVRSPLFMSIVYPAAFREVLNRIVNIEEFDDVDDDGDVWQTRWLKFATQLPGVGPIPDRDSDRDMWIDDAVAAFAKHQGMLDRFSAGWSKGNA